MRDAETFNQALAAAPQFGNVLILIVVLLLLDAPFDSAVPRRRQVW